MKKVLSLVITISLLVPPVTPVFAQVSASDVCTSGSNPNRPEGGCEQTVPFIHTELDEFPLTQPYRPVAEISGSSCQGIPVADDGSGPYVDATVFVNLSNIQIGGLGPDDTALQSKSPDEQAAFYPFIGLAGKPDSLQNAPKESFRTFYRLNPIIQQIKAKAKFLDAYKKGLNDPKNNKPIFNSEFYFYEGEYEVENSSSGSATLGQMKQHLFENSCDGQLCSDYIINNTVAQPSCNNQYLNPYLIIAIALNENGGLASNDPQGQSTHHFGCDLQCKISPNTTITSKFSCAYNTIKNDCGKPPEQFLLTEYGYSNFHNLNYIASWLGGCSSAGPDDKACFPVWMTKSEADAAASSLKSALPGQKDMWFRNYKPYLEQLNQRKTPVACGVADSNTKTGATISSAAKVTFTIQDLVDDLPSCLQNFPLGCKEPVRTYLDLPDDLRAKYDHFQPFDFDNVRGYLGLAYQDPSSPDEVKTTLFRENLPYVQAVNDLVNDPVYGIAYTLTPKQTNDKRKKEMTKNTYVLSPDGKEESIQGPFFNAFTQMLKDKTQKIWNLAAVPQLDAKYSGPDPESGWTKSNVSLQSPLTFPQRLPTDEIASLGERQQTGLGQTWRVPVKVRTEEVSVKECPGGYKHYVEYDASRGGKRGEGSFVIDNAGREIAVINNPKMLDISCSISGDNKSGKDCVKLGLVNQFLPDDQNSDFKNLPMRGEDAAYEGFGGGGDIHVQGKPSSDTDTNGPINRKDGSAHTDLCQLRNLWLVPQNQQRLTEDDCIDMP